MDINILYCLVVLQTICSIWNWNWYSFIQGCSVISPQGRFATNNLTAKKSLWQQEIIFDISHTTLKRCQFKNTWTCSNYGLYLSITHLMLLLSLLCKISRKAMDTLESTYLLVKELTKDGRWRFLSEWGKYYALTIQATIQRNTLLFLFMEQTSRFQCQEFNLYNSISLLMSYCFSSVRAQYLTVLDDIYYYNYC